MERRTIVIDYSPRTYFKPFHTSKKRWSVIVAHRRSGKTTACINHLQRDALKIANSRFAYISPTYKQSKNIAWDIAKHYSRVIPGIDYNEAELSIKYPNGSRITLYGADNPDSLRGIGLWGVVFDEYSQQPSNIFTEIIRPALADHSGYAIWIGTPKGKNEFWSLFEKAKQDKNWYSSLLTVDDTKIINKEELEDAKNTMSDDEFLQEFYCSFEASIKGAYYAKQLREAREDNRIGVVLYEPQFPVYTFWDLGIGDATSILFMQNINNQWRLFDCYENSGEGLAHYIAILAERGYTYASHYAPHDIAVKELGTGKSRLELARSLGIAFEISPNLSIEDGINAARLRFRELWISEDRCAKFLHAMSLYRKEWDDKRGEFRNKPLHDFTSHFADALRYWAVSTDQRGNETTVHYSYDF